MRASDWDAILDAVTASARDYLGSLPERRVYPDAPVEQVRAALDRPLSDGSTAAPQVVAELARDIDPYLAAHACGRYFGFVIGGLHPAAYGAELLASTWDQNAGLYAPTPGAAIVEEVAARWLLELLDLPGDSSLGLVTGGQMANFTCLAAARDHVLREAGWDVEADGLPGAPPVSIILKAGGHTTVPRALRFLGFGERTAAAVPCDDEDRYRVDELAATLAATSGPTIVCAEAGNVNTGAFDPFGEIAELAAAHRDRGNPTWAHVDGAVGLLAAAAPDRRHLVAGMDRLDSWSTDGHKLLNLPYDCGVAATRHPAAHRAAMSVRADYLVQGDGEVREAMDWNPEFSRRARGVAVYAALRALGREGVAGVVERTSSLARRFATSLAASGRAEIVNDVVFNQALVRWLPPAGDDPDRFNDDVTAAIQRDGTAYASGTTWRGRRMMRLSVCDWATDEADVERAAAAMLRCAGEVAGRR